MYRDTLNPGLSEHVACVPKECSTHLANGQKELELANGQLQCTKPSAPKSSAIVNAREVRAALLSSQKWCSVGTKLLPHIAPQLRRARSLGILSCHRTRAAPGQVRAHVSLPSSTAARHISLRYTTTHHAVKACRVRRWAKPCLRACEASSKPLSLHWCSMELSLHCPTSSACQVTASAPWSYKLRLTEL